MKLGGAGTVNSVLPAEKNEQMIYPLAAVFFAGYRLIHKFSYNR